MKTKLKILMAVALLLLAYAGRSQCNAAFTINDNGLGSIQFVPSDYPYYGDSVTQFLWTFGDGTGDTSFQAGVYHNYTSSGSYNICLTVIDPTNNCTNQSCQTFSVNLCSGASQFAISQIGFGEYSFNATAISGNAYTGTWNFGDGTFGSGLSTTHQYTSDGIYNPCFSVVGPGGCLDTTCQLITVALCQHFNVGFTYHTVSVNPYTAEFVATNPTDPAYVYGWSFGDGSYGGGIGQDSIAHAFTQNGPETVTLIVSQVSGYCYDSVKQTLNIDRCDLHPNINESSNGLTANFYVYLSDTPEQEIISNLWDFPGGNPPNSSGASTSVTYASLGTYTADLFISTQSGCIDTLFDTFTLTPSPPPVYSITGQIAGGFSGGRATVYLITQDTTGHLALIDSTVILLVDSGNFGAYYYFYNLPPDTYYVKAALNPDNQDYANYLPTYYNNALSWSAATGVEVNINDGSADGIDIALIAGTNPGGPGFVGGYVYQGAGIVLQQGNNLFRGVGDALAGVQINLLTSADEAVAYTFTDVGGHYQFSDLAYGSYKIYAEQLNKIPVPIPFTLSPSDSSISSLNISINSDSATTAGINDVKEISIQGIYPNPVINTLEVQLSSKQETNAVIKLVDILGKTVSASNSKIIQGNNKLELDMENLAPGVYQLLIQTSSQQLTYKVVKAK